MLLHQIFIKKFSIFSDALLFLNFHLLDKRSVFRAYL